MCRFFGFLSNAPAKVDWPLARAGNALLSQSRRDSKGDSHLDGWGIGYYAGRCPIVALSSRPAAEDFRFQVVARGVCTRAAIAHVRDASVGDRALINTHPFTYGPWLFAHNGTVRPFERVAPGLIDQIPHDLLVWRQGNTDSELVFYWLLARLQQAGMNPLRPCADISLLKRTISEATGELARRCDDAGDEGEPAKLNFLLTDGTVLLATSWLHSLCWAERRNYCFASRSPHAAGERHAVMVASEPVDDEKWQEVAARRLLTIDSELNTSIDPL